MLRVYIPAPEFDDLERRYRKLRAAVMGWGCFWIVYIAAIVAIVTSLRGA